jgi:hypothetical protein
MRKPPYLIAEIPSGPEGGHVTVTQPGSPVGELEVARVCQRFRMTAYAVEENLVAVSRDSVQVGGRNGRALLVLYRIDTARLGAEGLEEVKDRLLRRLGALGSLGQDEIVKNAKAGAVVECPLLIVWSDLDGLDNLPALADPAPSAPAAPGHSRGLRRLGLTLAGFAALAVVGLIVAMSFFSSSEKSIEIADKVTPVKNQATPLPSQSPKQVAAFSEPLDDQGLGVELDAALAHVPPVDLLDESQREIFDKNWPERLVKQRGSELPTLYGQYAKIYTKAIDFTVDRAIEACRKKVDQAIAEAFAEGPHQIETDTSAVDQLDEFMAHMKDVDQWLGKQRREGPLVLSRLTNEFIIFVDRQRKSLHEATYEFLGSEAHRMLGRPNETPPIRWSELLRFAQLPGILPDQQKDPTAPPETEALKRLKRFSSALRELDSRNVKLELMFLMRDLNPNVGPCMRLTCPVGVGDLNPEPDNGNGTLSNEKLSDTNGIWKYTCRFSSSPSSGNLVDIRFRWTGRLSSLFDAQIVMTLARDETSLPFGDKIVLSGGKILWAGDSQNFVRENSKSVLWAFRDRSIALERGAIGDLSKPLDRPLRQLSSTLSAEGNKP